MCPPGCHHNGFMATPELGHSKSKQTNKQTKTACGQQLRNCISVGIHLNLISTAFTDTKVKNCFSIYHTSWITSGPKSNFLCNNIPTKAILFFVGYSEVNSTWLITSELANQRARKALFTCVVYTNKLYLSNKFLKQIQFNNNNNNNNNTNNSNNNSNYNRFV